MYHRNQGLKSFFEVNLNAEHGEPTNQKVLRSSWRGSQKSYSGFVLIKIIEKCTLR